MRGIFHENIALQCLPCVSGFGAAISEKQGWPGHLAYEAFSQWADKS